MCDEDPQRASIDNSIKLTGFSAFTAGVTLLHTVLDHTRPATQESTTSRESNSSDEALIKRTMDTLEVCSAGHADSLCGRCFAALKGLVSSCQELGHGTVQRIDLPYFGVITIGPKPHAQASTYGDSSSMEAAFPMLPEFLDDIFWSYRGPLVNCDFLSPSHLSSL